MSDNVALAVIALIGSIATGTVIAWVGSLMRRREATAKAADDAASARTAARVKSEDKAQDELAIGRRDDRDRITKLETRLEEKDRQIATLQSEIEQLLDERRELRTTARELQVTVADLQRQVDQLKRREGDMS